MFKSAHGVIAALNERLARRRRTSRRKHRTRPRACAGAIESLEDRRLLAVITVTSLLDTVEDRDEALTLREAILIANDSTGATSFEGISSTDAADTIVFDPDVFVSDSGPIFLSQQLPVVTELLTIDGAVDSHRVAIDGLNESRILENASAGLTLRKLILQNGFVLGDGGALLNNRDAVLDLNNVDVIDSTAARNIGSVTLGAFSATGGCGGGIYNVTSGTVTIANSTFAGNTAQRDGGGVFNDAGGALTIADSTISGNTAGFTGGGLLNAGTATLTTSTVTGNQTDLNGGGILNRFRASLVLTDSDLSGNSAEGFGGGLHTLGTVTIGDSTISSNTAGMAGGGLFNRGTATLTASTVAGNQANDGGGLFNLSAAMLTASTVTGNHADRHGGGVSNHTTGTLAFDQTVISSNIALADGGGLWNAGTATLTASTIVGNTADIRGGGIANDWTAALVLEGTQVLNNVASVDGGGLANVGTTTITGGTFSGNLAFASGGGIANKSDALSDATLTITGTTISGNEAAGGGGIFNGALYGSGATITATGVTISGNTASEGAGLHNFRTGALATIVNSIILANAASFRGGGVSNASGAMVEVTDSTISGNTAGSNGGGLHNAGTAMLTASTVSGNQADLSGGGIYTLGALTITDGTVSGNEAFLSGGGISVGSGTATLARVSITGNTAFGEHGGGLSSSATLAIADSTISANDADEEGGGIFVESGTATIVNVSVSGNTAGQAGGGLSNWFGAVAIADSTIADNTADGRGGGIFSGLFDSETGSIPGTLSIEHSIVSGNAAEAGGGISNVGAATITSSAICGNTAAVGPGVAPNGGGINNIGQLTITDTSVADNTADGLGGGLFNGAGATASLAFVSVTANSSVREGGGIANFGNVTISSSTISGNIAEGSGGGIRNASFGSAFGTPTLVAENSTISGNTAVNGGGISARGGTVALLNVTVASNFASGNGGGVNIGSGAVTATSTIIASNAAAAGPDVRGALTDLGFNLIGNTAGISFATGQSVSTLVNVDPRLGPLQDNGGPTFTHALLPGSPAINKGSNPTEALFDQRGPGFGRTQGGQTDIGAFEVQSRPVPGMIVVGSGIGTAPEIRVFDPDTNQLLGSFAPFPSFFRGGIRVATGDVNGDGVADIVASAAPKAPPRVRVFDGTDLTGGTVLMDFFAYHAGFGGGVFVATGDVNNDGRADIITSPGAGGGPRVKVFSGADLTGGTTLMNFLAYARHFRGGVKVAAGDINGDNRDDVITGTGAGGGPRVKVFSGADLTGGTALMNFLAYARHFRGGVQVAAGDINGDGRGDVITGAGLGGGPRVRAFSGAGLSGATLLADLLAYDRSFRGGVRVATADVNGDGVVDIITGTGALGGSQVRAFDGMSGQRVARFFASPPGSTRGVFVAGVSRRTTEPPPISAPSSGFGGSGLSSGSFQLVDDLFSDMLFLDQLQSL